MLFLAAISTGDTPISPGQFAARATVTNASGQSSTVDLVLATTDGAPVGPVVLAGPTCDSADVLYERADYHLPLALAAGDQVDLLSAGAYTATYSTVCFNGFPPLRTYDLAAR